jgi:hypothetical protein
LVVVEEPGQAQVEDLYNALAVNEDVARLDVAVDQPGRVRMLQANGRPVHVVAGARHVHRPGLADNVLQAGAVHVLHDQKV